ncbi:MAG: RHS repeat-associated core domain-containing protein [Vicinamibacteria bacterium]
MKRAVVGRVAAAVAVALGVLWPQEAQASVSRGVSFKAGPIAETKALPQLQTPAEDALAVVKRADECVALCRLAASVDAAPLGYVSGRQTPQGVKFLYDDTSLLAEYDTNGLEVAKYDYGGDRLIRLTRTDEGTRYFSFDGLGSVTALTTTTGAVAAAYHLDAWGNYRFTSELAPSKNRFGFTGHYWDNEAGLYYAKARYYDPFTARFTQADSFLGNIDDPPSLHRYAYAAANPIFYTDPTGNYSWREAKDDVQWASNFSNAFQREYVTGFGEATANVASLGGYSGVKRAYAEGRITAGDGFSGLRAYNEGVANFATFGAVEGFVDARAGEGRDLHGSVIGAGEGVARTLLPIDEVGVVLSDTATGWQKAEAVATGVTKTAGLILGGLAAKNALRGRSTGPVTIEEPRTPTPSVADASASRHAGWGGDLTQVNRTVRRLGQRALRESAGDWVRSEALFESYLGGVGNRLSRGGSRFGVEMQPAALPGGERVPGFLELLKADGSGVSMDRFGRPRLVPYPGSRRLDAGIIDLTTPGPNRQVLSGFDITLNRTKRPIVDYYQEAFGKIPIFDVRLPH